MHNELVHQFLKTHPQECAREIENFSLDDMLFFIKQLQKKEAADIISFLIPSIAAVCFQNLSIEQSKEIIKILPFNALKKILPRIHEELRFTFIEMMPKNQRIALQHILNFSPHAIGAFMNTRVLFLPITHNVTQSIAIIKDFSEEIDSLIFCIDNRGELQGMVSLKDVMLSAPDQIIGDLIQECPLVFSADTNIQSIIMHEIWQTQSMVPVIDEHKNLLGVLEYNKIIKEIQQSLIDEHKDNIADSLAHIMFMFSHTTEQIINELSEL